jgi:hypothetical protein
VLSKLVIILDYFVYFLRYFIGIISVNQTFSPGELFCLRKTLPEQDIRNRD